MVLEFTNSVLVIEAVGKVCVAVHVLAFPKAKEMTTAPVVGLAVRVPSEFDTLETPLVPLLEIADHAEPLYWQATTLDPPPVTQSVELAPSVTVAICPFVR